MENYTLPEGKVLVLRSCKPDMSSQKNFVWPTSGPVECPDWKDNNECGNGLHGWLWATGNFSLMYKEVGARWLVVEVNADDIRDLDKEKVKYPRGNVLFTDSFRKTYDFVMKHFWLQHAAEMKAGEVIDLGANFSNEDEVSVVNTLIKGHASASGYSGHASASGDYGHASASGYSGHASASGNYGHASASGNYGHASASGSSGHASASGNYGHASASGNYGHACVLGRQGKAQCGENGAIILTYWDETAKRNRHVVGYAGENGIEAGKLYCLSASFEFEEVKQ